MRTLKKAIGNIELKDEVSDVVCEKNADVLWFTNTVVSANFSLVGFPECRNAKAIVKKTGTLCPKCGKSGCGEKKTKSGKLFYGCEVTPNVTLQAGINRWTKNVPYAVRRCISARADLRANTVPNAVTKKRARRKTKKGH
ncbi:MAG: hypothetical protein L6V93_08700 [Clostridiales bacterium]|nr:MAG: hypothetical protein L6V93_08700 [Clostridiales bacterium]